MKKENRNFKKLVTILITATMCSVLLPHVSADPVGIVSYWDCDEGIGSIINDGTNGNDGTFSGGKFGNALEFDGLNDYVNIPDDSTLDITGDITLEAWIKINSFSTSAGLHMYIIGKDSAGQRSYGIGVDLAWQQPKKPFVIMFHSGGSYQITWGLNQLVENQWYHIAGVFDETADQLELYVNGVYQATQTDTSTVYPGTADLRLGGRQYAGAECYFNGIIDEVRISDIVRYSGSFTPQTTPFTSDANTVGLWHFDESTGATTHDESANGNDGTINGAVWAGPTWTTGYSGDGIHLDGVDDYIIIADDASLEPETITVECYVKSNVLEYYAYIISKDYTSGFGASSYAFYTGSTRGLYFYVKTSSSPGYALSPNAGTSVWNGEWHHIVGTYDGINPRLYVDGIEVTGTPGTGDDILYSATGNLLFGTYSEIFTHPTYDFYFNGDIDEVKIYNYAIDTLNLAFDPTSDAVVPVETDANIRTVVTDGLGNTVGGVTVELSATAADPESADLSLPTSGETDSNGVFAFTASSTTTGIYTITATILTPTGDIEDTWTLVVYDPTAGFVTGGGWIYSPAGAYIPDDTLEGKANFGFVSKYKRGQSTPDGNTEFQFKAGDLNFHSTEYEWLVIAGCHAKFKGSGTINGGGNYGFMLTATDGQINGGGGVDKFRIKIWDKDNGDAIVYDNNVDDLFEYGTELGGGQIKIHSG